MNGNIQLNVFDGNLSLNISRHCRGGGRVESRQSLQVKVPPGVDDGARLRLVGEGEAGVAGGPSGDLYVVIHTRPHPLFERDGTDLHIEVPAVKYDPLSSSIEGIGSRSMRELVEHARGIQRDRFMGQPTRFNAQMTSRQTRQFCRLDSEGRERLRRSLEQLGLSARAYDKILRLARTIADVEEEPEVLPAHVSEAINYRTLDRQI